MSTAVFSAGLVGHLPSAGAQVYLFPCCRFWGIQGCWCWVTERTNDRQDNHRETVPCFMISWQHSWRAARVLTQLSVILREAATKSQPVIMFLNNVFCTSKKCRLAWKRLFFYLFLATLRPEVIDFQWKVTCGHLFLCEYVHSFIIDSSDLLIRFTVVNKLKVIAVLWPVCKLHATATKGWEATILLECWRRWKGSFSAWC